ncbi:MAG TPA: hypothetical protein VIN34_00125 [Candidatus Limnocylindria bacterium]|jgi:hypothetical protein
MIRRTGSSGVAMTGAEIETTERTREEARENVLDALQVVLAPDEDDKGVLAGRSEALDLTLIR